MEEVVNSLGRNHSMGGRIKLFKLLVNAFPYIKTFYGRISFFLVATLLITTISYLLTYSFLYGFYFGGTEMNFYSNFDLIKNFIPFESDTLVFTGLFGSLLISCITMIVPLVKKK